MLNKFNFLQYKTPDELFKKTGLTVKEALQKIDEEIEELKDHTGGID